MRVEIHITPQIKALNGREYPYDLFICIKDCGVFPSPSILSEKNGEIEIVDWDRGNGMLVIHCRSYEEAIRRKEDFLKKLSNFLKEWLLLFSKQDKDVLEIYEWNQEEKEFMLLERKEEEIKRY